MGMMRRERHVSVGVCLAALAALSCLAAAGEAETRPRALRAAVSVLPPFVMEAGAGVYEGMAIEAMEGVAAGLGDRVEYVRYGSVPETLAAVERGEADIAVNGISMTKERAERLLFTFPWHSTGVKIMTRAEQPGVWTALRRDHRIRMYGLFSLIFLVLALLMTAVRRARDPQFPPDWLSGYCLSLCDVVVSVRSGKLDQKYLGWIGNLLSVLWMVAGVAAVTYVTSTLTTAMTAVSMETDRIRSVADLSGRRVGVLRGGMGHAYLEKLHVDVIVFDDMEEMAGRLRTGALDAVVGDAPPLEYRIRRRPGDGFEMVDAVLHPDKLGFAVRPERDDGLGDRVTLELIRLHDAGVLRNMAVRYLGAENGGPAASERDSSRP